MKKNGSAFTMLEIVASIAIMSSCMLAIFMAAGNCISANKRCQNLSKAVLTAESLFNKLCLESDISYETATGKSGEYNWKIKTIQTEVEDLARVEISVSYEQQGAEQKYQLVSFLYLKPISQGSNE